MRGASLRYFSTGKVQNVTCGAFVNPIVVVPANSVSYSSVVTSINVRITTNKMFGNLYFDTQFIFYRVYLNWWAILLDSQNLSKKALTCLVHLVVTQQNRNIVQISPHYTFLWDYLKNIQSLLQQSKNNFFLKNKTFNR